MKFIFIVQKKILIIDYLERNISLKWLNKFKFNCDYARKNVEVIAGLSPGLDFDFKSYIEETKKK